MGRWSDIVAKAEADKARMEAAKRAKIAAEPKGQKISEVGERTAAGLACPKCGGTQFKPKRSGLGKVAAGVLAPKTEVRCITCKTDYKRG